MAADCYGTSRVSLDHRGIPGYHDGRLDSHDRRARLERVDSFRIQVK